MLEQSKASEQIKQDVDHFLDYYKKISGKELPLDSLKTQVQSLISDKLVAEFRSRFSDQSIPTLINIVDDIEKRIGVKLNKKK